MNAEQQPTRNRQETTSAEQMRSGVRTLQPPVARLVAGGLARGQRIRRVRRLQATALAVTAATAAIATGAVATEAGGTEVAGLLTDARGLGQALVRVAPATAGRRPVGCPDHTGTRATCTIESLPDGSALHLDHNFAYPARPVGDDGSAGSSGHGAVINSAELVRSNGWTLYFLATDSAEEKSGRATHPGPVLTLDQLTTIVTDPAWKTLPAPTSAHTAGRKR